MTLESLQNKLHEHSIENIQTFATVHEAYRAAASKAGENDRIVVFGSFHTVADVMSVL